MLDAQTKRLLAGLAESGVRPLHEYPDDEARRLSRDLAAANGPGPSLASAIDKDADGVPVKVLVPFGRPQGVVVWLHPGGWVVGSPDETETIARKLAERTSCVWVLPGYRLAPEHRHPAALEDCQAGLDWAAERITQLAGRPVPLMIGGEGAGATLATALARRARDRGGPSLFLQILIYPLADASSLDVSAEGEDGLLFTADTVRWALDRYAPDMSDRLDPVLSPLRAADHVNLPPALIVAAEHCPLSEQDAAYADRLRQAGVPVTFRMYPGQVHGFFSMMESRLGERAFQDVIKAVRATAARWHAAQPSLDCETQGAVGR